MDTLITILAYIVGYGFCFLLVLYGLTIAYGSVSNLWRDEEPWKWIKDLFPK